METTTPKTKKHVRIRHTPSNQVIAEGPMGWGITPFEGNLYIGRKYMKSDGFKVNYLPGLCSYKFLYVWMDFHWGEGMKSRNLGWFYWLPNPLFPFIAFRIAIPRHHHEIEVEEYSVAMA